MVKVPKSRKPTTKGTKLGPKGGVSKKLKFQGKCFNCGKQGHISIDCRLSKRNKPKEANVVDDINKDKSKIDLIEAISEVSFVGSNPKERWINTSGTRYVCRTKRCAQHLNQLILGKGVHGKLYHL